MGTEVLVQQFSGTIRSLTQVFILLRNNAIQSRNLNFDAISSSSLRNKLATSRSAANDDDRLSLIPLDDGSRSCDSFSNGFMTPEWVNIVDEVQYEMLRVQTRIKELKDIQQRHINTLNFSDEKSQEEHTIELATAEITKMLSHCHRLVQLIQNAGPPMSRDIVLRKNVIVALIQSLQSMTLDFRSSQSTYLNQIKNRQANCEQFFDEQFGSTFASSKMLPDFDSEFSTPLPSDQQLSMKQLQMLHENSAMAQEREREISSITKSIVEVNHLFKDLASFIVDQGAVVDRIDYNIEQTSVKTRTGLKSVKKAEEYQRKNRKMWCIVALSIALIVLLILLIIVKS